MESKIKQLLQRESTKNLRSEMSGDFLAEKEKRFPCISRFANLFPFFLWKSML